MGNDCAKNETIIARGMRILIATGIFPPDIGGPATYVATIAPELARRGLSVEIVTYARHDAIESVQGITVEKVDRNTNTLSRYISYCRALARRMRKVEYVFAQDPMSSGLPATLMSKLFMKKFVIKVVGDYVWEQASQRYGLECTIDEWQGMHVGVLLGVWRWLERWVARQADEVIVPSVYLKNIVRAWGVESNKIRVVYNAVEMPALHVDEKDSNVWVSVGRLVPWKGFTMLISLMAHYPTKRLEIIGDGPDRAKLEEYIRAHGVQDRVRLRGALPREETLHQIATAQLFLLNTNYEGLSHTLLESLLLGTPVVTTNVGGNPEVVTDGVTGHLLSYNDVNRWRKVLDEYASGTARCVSIPEDSTRMLLTKFSYNGMIEGLMEVFR